MRQDFLDIHYSDTANVQCKHLGGKILGEYALYNDDIFPQVNEQFGRKANAR